jgi:phospholipid/cholesterol/gamma-HCH transport system substrate-binding protein
MQKDSQIISLLTTEARDSCNRLFTNEAPRSQQSDRRFLSIASIQTEGVVGDQFVSIGKGTESSGEVGNGSTLPSKEPVDLAALLEDGSSLLKEVHGDIGDIRARTDVVLDTATRTLGHTDDLIIQSRPDISTMLGNGARISATVDTIVEGLNEGRGTAGLILTDEDTKQKLRATVEDVHDASVNIDQASVRANHTMADFQSRDLPAKTQQTLDNVQSLSLRLNTAVKEALAEDDIGQDGATNLRQALSGLNRSTTNVAEDTEALKHNFLLRGFFKRRGFYNLDEITPTCDRRRSLTYSARSTSFAFRNSIRPVSSLHCLIQSAQAAFPYDQLGSLGKEGRSIFRRRTCSPLDSSHRIPSSSCAIGCQ